ncbi:MAG: response regulator [Gammaproteobacteria bacterium]|nr:response regulator [Gammaproteobacteria bacterium]MDD9957802.1 response regulator [Gammaproteobacteria bacterium]
MNDINQQYSEAPSKVDILLVDDYEENRTVLEFVLRHLEVTCHHASSCDEAVDKCKDLEFALIILDYHMPVKNGFQTARYIKQLEKNTDTPIIFLTADTESENLDNKGYECGAVDFIYKPLDPRKIRAKVQVFIELYKKRLNA